MSDRGYGFGFWFGRCWDWRCAVGSGFRLWFDVVEASLAASGVLFAGRDIGVAVLFPFFFLNEIDIGDHDSFLVRVILVCFGPETALVRLLINLPLTFCVDATSAAFGNRSPPRGGVCDDAPDIHASLYRSTSQLLPRACRESSSFFRIDASQATGFMHGDTAPTTKLVTGREEAFARVTLAN